MSLFDNMLDLNNSFLLIALIIIAVICIYLLYSNLTKSGETVSLKSGINALIQQNKKRDEIINFLLERVENLEHNVPPAQILPAEQTPVTHSIPVIADDIDDVLSSVEQPVINTASASEVEDILESITNTVCTGIESPAQCNATASTSFSGPPEVGLKLNVGGTPPMPLNICVNACSLKYARIPSTSIIPPLNFFMSAIGVNALNSP